MWQYKIGTVVRSKYSDAWGHVVGFTKNSSNETVLRVQWSDGEVSSPHPKNVECAEDMGVQL